MALPASSRTCFALLSSIEVDLRQAIVDLADGGTPVVVLGEALAKTAGDRRAKEYPRASSLELSALLPYVDFADALTVLRRLDSRLPGDSAEQLKRLVPEWESIIPIRNRVAHSRPLEADDLFRVYEFAEKVTSLPLCDWDSTLTTRAELERNPGFTLGLQHLLRVDAEDSIRHNLPPADFDETGFLGRKNLRKAVHKAIKGPWPVVSILGDGGLGKTALALQVAYDISVDPASGFDAIVWTTAKNKTLTTAEILRIEDAIQDSLGLIENAVQELAGDAVVVDPIDELLEYLETFKILLVLDNLETVIDDRIRDFLRALPNGSKVLITSRIGVGTENPFKVGPLEVAESVQLLRLLARTRDVHLLSGLSQEEAILLAEQLKGHPAYIKWFVSGVQAGVAPERMLENNDLLLDYCMDNVFRYLGEDARAVLRSMLVAPGVQTLAELAYLNDFDSARINTCVLELTSTNFLSRVRGGAGGTGYSLSDFAKTYLNKTYPVTEEERSWILDRQSHLYRVGADLQAAHQLDPYNEERVDVRGAGDFNAARLLLQALELSREGQHDAALRATSEAAELAPGYHETHRIIGYINERALNLTEAHDAYEHAVELAPASPSAHLFFGRFLVRTSYNLRLGLRTLQTASRLDDGSPSTRLAIAQAQLALGNISDAVDVCGSLVNSHAATKGWAVSAVNLACDATLSAMNTAVRAKNWSQVAQLCEAITELVERATVDDLEAPALDILFLLEGWATTAAKETGDDFIGRRCAEFSARLRERRRQVDPAALERLLGSVERPDVNKGFAFLTDGGTKYFLHASALRDRHLFESLRRGSIVGFRPGPGDGARPKALDVYWIV